jgi:hypothetical protein
MALCKEAASHTICELAGTPVRPLAAAGEVSVPLAIV